ALWLGAAYELEGDKDAARVAYERAMRRLGNGIALPRPVAGREEKKIPGMNAFGRSLQGLLYHSHGDKFASELKKLTETLALIANGGPKQAEAGVRALGELLGFTATRPDNDEG